MQNKYLKRIAKTLKSYYFYFKHENILVVSEDKATLPFAFLISDEIRHPGKILLSLAVNYPFSEKAVALALGANAVKPIMIADNFFIGQNGTTYIGEDASKYFELETYLPIDEIIPDSKNVH